jgi:hypothetical protein
MGSCASPSRYRRSAMSGASQSSMQSIIAFCGLAPRFQPTGRAHAGERGCDRSAARRPQRAGVRLLTAGPARPIACLLGLRSVCHDGGAGLVSGTVGQKPSTGRAPRKPDAQEPPAVGIAAVKMLAISQTVPGRAGAPVGSGPVICPSCMPAARSGSTNPISSLICTATSARLYHRGQSSR